MCCERLRDGGHICWGTEDDEQAAGVQHSCESMRNDNNSADLSMTTPSRRGMHPEPMPSGLQDGRPSLSQAPTSSNDLPSVTTIFLTF